jgi:YlmC/YmxH family sporulation protein
MLLSEIGDKEIVDLSNGSLHGRLWDAEMVFDERTGIIHSLLVPNFQGSAMHSKGNLHLPWNSIVTIGDDLIIFKS